ncbi:MAG: hypothetical protein H6567_02150 [Lewinellaceae bacterium]|nr:hypothetical protein [Lewinellaceae bacterium]
MKPNIKEIQLKTGIGDLKFGMLKPEVRQILGEPEEISEFESDASEEDLLESWHYDTLELTLVFDPIYEDRLVSIGISDPHYKLEGKSVVGMSMEDCEKFLEKLNIQITDNDDMSSEEEPDLWMIECEESGMLIWISDDEVIEVQINPIVDNEDNVAWPQR